MKLTPAEEKALAKAKWEAEVAAATEAKAEAYKAEAEKYAVSDGFAATTLEFLG